ncbi:hypothetical protein REPUB_Repub18cG0077900 [Reevesia pubescens]
MPIATGHEREELEVELQNKNGNSGWLNTVTNAATSAAGKASFPSVYTSFGYAVQHKVLPSFGGEAGDSASRIGPGSTLQVQEKELRVKVEAMQAWDDLSKSQDRSHLYLSNAEVHISSGRIPIWQNSKVSFYTMSPVGFDEHKFTADQSGGEIGIEQMHTQEIEIGHRDLLPVF